MNKHQDTTDAALANICFCLLFAVFCIGGCAGLNYIDNSSGQFKTILK